MNGDLHDQEVYILSGAGEGVPSVDGYHFRGFQGFLEGEGTDSLPEGLVPNVRMTKGNLDLDRCDNLDE